MTCPTTTTSASKTATKKSTTYGRAATKNTTRHADAKSSAESIWTSSNWTSDAWTGVTEPEVYASATWVDSAAGYCAAALYRVAAIIEGVAQERSLCLKRSLCLTTLDVGFETNFNELSVLAVSREWQSGCAIAADDDNSSCTTDEVSSDSEDASDSDICSDEIRASDTGRMRLTQYLCRCDECALDKTIAESVKVATPLSSLSKQLSVVRVLRAFASYNEVVGFHASMIPAALDCVQSSCGDEDAAFASFVTLYYAY